MENSHGHGFTALELSKKIPVSYNTVNNWIKAGKLEVKYFGKKRYISEEVFHKIVKQGFPINTQDKV